MLPLFVEITSDSFKQKWIFMYCLSRALERFRSVKDLVGVPHKLRAVLQQVMVGPGTLRKGWVILTCTPENPKDRAEEKQNKIELELDRYWNGSFDESCSRALILRKALGAWPATAGPQAAPGVWRIKSINARLLEEKGVIGSILMLLG